MSKRCFDAEKGEEANEICQLCSGLSESNYNADREMVLSKYNIKQAEMHSCNGIDVDDDVAVGSDYGQW